MTKKAERLPCAIQCMTFNETAWTLAEEIKKAVGNRPNVILNVDDLADLRIGKYEGHIICEEGWELN